uniref:Uncharacterized protein n=1 Tax=Cannabis sativa TaxID=3483 RepID=A0A803QGJ7_CANSA
MSTHNNCMHVKIVEIPEIQPAPTNVPQQYNIDPHPIHADMPIMTQVMGERSRHLRGLGQLPRLWARAKRATPKLGSFGQVRSGKGGAKRETPKSGPSGQSTVTQEEYEALKRRVKEQEARNECQK